MNDELNQLKEAYQKAVADGLELKRQRDEWKEDAERLAMNAHHFASGIEFVNWGKIKANLPTELAKQITHLNYLADSALAAHNNLTNQMKESEG